MKRSNDSFEYGALAKYAFAGVYMIKCFDTNKCYIGSSTNIGSRIGKHLSELKYNRHTNKGLQLDFNKKFKFGYKVLERCSHSQLLNLETKHLKSYDINELYNEHITGYYISEDLKSKRANSNKDSHQTEEYRQYMSNIKSQKVCMLNRDTEELICIFDSVKEVCDLNTEFRMQPIRGVCNGSKKTAYGYKWKWLKDLKI